MKRSFNNRIRRYTHGEYNIDIVTKTGVYEAWLSRNDMSISAFMFGVSSADVSFEEFIEIVQNNLTQYICNYIAEYDDEPVTVLSVGDKVLADDLLCEILEVNEEDGVFYYDVTPVEGIAHGFTRTFTLKDLRPAPEE